MTVWVDRLLPRDRRPESQSSDCSALRGGTSDDGEKSPSNHNHRWFIRPVACDPSADAGGSEDSQHVLARVPFSKKYRQIWKPLAPQRTSIDLIMPFVPSLTEHRRTRACARAADRACVDGESPGGGRNVTCLVITNAIPGCSPRCSGRAVVYALASANCPLFALTVRNLHRRRPWGQVAPVPHFPILGMQSLLPGLARARGATTIGKTRLVSMTRPMAAGEMTSSWV